MSQLTTKIQVEDGQVLSAYAKPVANASAAIVVLQEIFGVNSHIRSVG